MLALRALFLHALGAGKALMVASVLRVLVVALLNSSMEAAVDRCRSKITPSPNGPRTLAARRCW